MRILIVFFFISVISCNTKEINTAENKRWTLFAPDSSQRRDMYVRLTENDTLLDSVFYYDYKFDTVFLSSQLIYNSDIFNSTIRINRTNDSLELTVLKPYGQWVAIHEYDSNDNLINSFWGPSEPTYPRDISLSLDSIQELNFQIDDWTVIHINDSFGVKSSRIYFNGLDEKTAHNKM